MFRLAAGIWLDDDRNIIIEDILILPSISFLIDGEVDNRIYVMCFVDETKHCIFFLLLHAYFLRDFLLVTIPEAATIASLCCVSMCIFFVEDALG